MDKVEIIGSVNPEARGRQFLVKCSNEYFVVSSATVLGEFETLVFPADKNGVITSWNDIAGGRGMSQQEAIDDLARGGHSRWSD